VALVLLGLAVPFGYAYWSQRLTHSATEDAFVEAHLVNVTPQSVSGHIIRFLADENDRVEQGQLLAEIDPVSYRDQVNLARSKKETAEAEWHRQQAGYDRLCEEVPIQIEMAKRTRDAAEEDERRARETVTLTRAEVEHGIDEAKAVLAAAEADLVFAEQEYTRYTNLAKEMATTSRRAEEATGARNAARGRRDLARAKLARAEAARTQIDVAQRTLQAAEKLTLKAKEGVKLAETGEYQIKEVDLLVKVKKEEVQDAKRALESAEDNLRYTQIRAPFAGIIVKRYRHLGDFASPGVAILSLYNPDLIYVTANLEETRLRGVAPGNQVELELDAFAEPFRGRVVWINKSTGAQFALMPRNVVAGEFTKVVQRVPVRIWIEKDDRWPLLRAGLSARVVIAHGDGDAVWAQQAAKDLAQMETRFNEPQE
jgi:membrane fusion protein (multidrug efflux system)